MRDEFHRELQRLEARLQFESDLVMRSLRLALTALDDSDDEAAEEVIRFDDQVDAVYLEIEQGIQDLLATQTPVASDLRLVLSILHVNLHLERMADYCVTIAKLVKLTENRPEVSGLIEAFEEMGSRAEEMIRVAVDSFAARDVARSESLVELDELIDRANRHVLDEVFMIADDLEVRRWSLRMLIVSRCLERIGDHAVDIGEQTAYLVTGEFREYTDASRPSPTEA
jgi:phosphate transport system protein